MCSVHKNKYPWFKDRIVLSNMPESSISVDDDNKTVVFQTTPVMSTYLVAIVVGEFDFVESSTPDGIREGITNIVFM